MLTFKRVAERRLDGRWAGKLFAVSLALGFIAPAADCAEFFAVVENTGRKPYASLELAVDTRSGIGANVDFSVYDVQGTQISQFFVPTNVHGFASTASFANLFDLSAGQPMVIRAITQQDIVNSGATLNVRSANGPMTFAVHPFQKLDSTLLSAGRLFSIPVGDFRSARLLIANVSGAQVNVDVFQGTEHAPGNGTYSNPRLPNRAHWRVDLTQNEARSNIVITASGVIIVQVVMDDGKALHSFMVTPTA